MSLILALGSNLGDRNKNLIDAKILINNIFPIISESTTIETEAVDYLNQPPFLNQVIECITPHIDYDLAWQKISQIENELGRNRTILKGPRTIDIDVIFWDLNLAQSKSLIIPHPEWNKRYFVFELIKELPYFQILKNHFLFPQSLKA